MELINKMVGKKVKSGIKTNPPKKQFPIKQERHGEETELRGSIGREIMRQINTINPIALKSYGAKNFLTFENGIQFDVFGSIFKGRVLITLNPDDLYDIELGRINRKTLQWISVKKVTDIFVEDLVSTLDKLIR